jgi:TPR repeat protein
LTDKSSEEEIKSAYVNEMTEALIFLGEHYGWDIQRILALKAEIVRRNYKFYGAFGAYKSSPDRRNTAQVAWTTDDYINIGVNVKNKKNNNEIWVPIISVAIALGLFETLCKKFFWVDNNTVRIVQKNMRDYWDVDIVQGISTFHYPRAENGDAHGQYDFAKMYIDGWLVEQDMGKAVMWLEKSAAQGFKRAIRLLERIKSGETNLADPYKNTKKR